MLKERKDATSSTPSSGVLGHRRQRHGLERRRLAQAGGDAEVTWRKIRELDGSALVRALADQPLTEPDRTGGVRGVGQAVHGDPVQLSGRSSKT